MTQPTPQPGIMEIAPYQGGASTVEGLSEVIKLSSNESALGPSPKAIAAYKAIADDLHRYPDGGADSLCQALAAHYGLAADRIVCGNGSDELISLLTDAYAGVGDEVLYSRHGFLMYRLATLGVGATPVAAPETDYTASVDALLAAVTDKTRIVFLANPNNPTGTYLAQSEVRRLRENLPESTLLVIDAAYAEFVDRNDYTPGQELVDEFGNVVMTRTFSKIYGLAGLRVGWAYCSPDVAGVLHRVRGPFNVNSAAQAAAVAALSDTGHTAKAKAHNDVWLPWTLDELGKLGLDVVPSVGNFVLVHFPDEPGRSAGDAYAYLAGEGVLLRGMAPYNLPGALRITIGTESELKDMVAAFRRFLAR